MAKKEKEQKPNRNPKTWEGYEETHSLAVGDIVKVLNFGRTTDGWEVIALTLDPEHELPTYSLKSPDGTKYPYIGKWYNKNTYSQIVN